MRTHSSWEHNIGLQDNVSPVYVLSLDAHMIIMKYDLLGLCL